jgi:hypothetical protein
VGEWESGRGGEGGEGIVDIDFTLPLSPSPPLPLSPSPTLPLSRSFPSRLLPFHYRALAAELGGKSSGVDFLNYSL